LAVEMTFFVSPRLFEKLLLGGIALICILAIVLNIILNVGVITIQTKISRNLRLMAMDGFLDYPYAFFVKNTTSRLYTLVGNDMEKFAELFSSYLRLFFSALQLLIIMGFILIVLP
ncbi:MAG: ABC transporter ATP-binding protein, partial [Deltaproteobacteria bacterium]|nr:ABC transporter ATP-binding protein [Deltaproteobacteria bacterium]